MLTSVLTFVFSHTATAYGVTVNAAMTVRSAMPITASGDWVPSVATLIMAVKPVMRTAVIA